MKVLVAGAGGFIGGHLSASLRNDGFEVICVDIKPLELWFQYDETKLNYTLDLKELKADLLREEQEEDYPDLEPKDNTNTNKVKKPLEPFTIDELPDIDINFL